jgi:hypothetical protein
MNPKVGLPGNEPSVDLGDLLLVKVRNKALAYE